MQKLDYATCVVQAPGQGRIVKVKRSTVEGLPVTRCPEHSPSSFFPLVLKFTTAVCLGVALYTALLFGESCYKEFFFSRYSEDYDALRSSAAQGTDAAELVRLAEQAKSRESLVPEWVNPVITQPAGLLAGGNQHLNNWQERDKAIVLLSPPVPKKVEVEQLPSK